MIHVCVKRCLSVGDEVCLGLATHHVDSSVAKVHHYRETCPPEHYHQYCSAEDFKEQLTEDKVIRNWEKKVVQNLVKVFQVIINLLKEFKLF